MTFDGVGRLLLLAAVWGGSFLFVGFAAPSFGPVPLIFLRVSSAALLLVPLVLLRGDFSLLRAHAGKLFMLGVFNSAAPFTLLAYATLELGAGLGSILNATAPLWGAVLSFLLLGEKVARMRAFGLALGFAGVALLVNIRAPIETAGEPDFRLWKTGLLPAAAALTATLLYAGSALASKRYFKEVKPLVVTAGSQAGATVVMLPLALFLWPTTTPPALAWGAALSLGLACTAFAYVLYFQLIAEKGAAQGLAVTYLIPVFGVLWGALFLGEQVTWGMLSAALMILAGTALSSDLGVRLQGKRQENLESSS